HGKPLPVEASFSKPSVPDRHYCHERKLSERVPFEIEYASRIRLLRCGLKPCRQSTCAHFVGVRHSWAFARSCTSSRASEAAVVHKCSTKTRRGALREPRVGPRP